MLVTTIENVHPNPYHSISKDKFRELCERLSGSLEDSVTERETWLIFSRIMAALDEGHSTVGFPEDLKNRIRGDEVNIFPVLIREYNGRDLVVRYDLSEKKKIRAGDRITAINGEDVPQLVDEMRSCYGGLSVWKNRQVIRDFGGNLLLQGLEAPYTIEYIREQDGLKYEVDVSGTTFSELQKRVAEIRNQSNTGNTAAPNYTFTRMEPNIGYLNFRSMTDLKAFEKFLDSVFTGIKENPVSGLIIDLRQNGGGNSVLGERLISYITSKPYRMGAGSLWKVSDEYKEFIRGQAGSNPVYASGSFQGYLGRKTGELIRSTAAGPSPPAKNDLRYEGKVCVLIGPNTFSSANMLANAIGDYKLATLIGEPSGEPGNDYGELYWNKLPHSGLVFYTCVKQFIRANGDAENVDPVMPDIEVKQHPESQKDDVLEFTISWIRNTR